MITAGFGVGSKKGEAKMGLKKRKVLLGYSVVRDVLAEN